MIRSGTVMRYSLWRSKLDSIFWLGDLYEENDPCLMFRGPHLYIESDDNEDSRMENVDILWENFNALTVPWDPFLKNAQRILGKEYPESWDRIHSLQDTSLPADIMIMHPHIPKDYEQRQREIHKDKLEIQKYKETEIISEKWVIGSILFFIKANLLIKIATIFKKIKEGQISIIRNFIREEETITPTENPEDLTIKEIMA